MIETIAYTYWTDNGSNIKNNFPTIESFKEMWVESYNGIKNTMPKMNIFIMTDKEGADIAKECCPDSEINIINYDKYDFDKRLWCYPKLITYNYLAKKNIPFLHIDQDVEMLKPLTNQMLNADILTELTRVYVKNIKSRLPKVSYTYDIGLGDINPQEKLVCSGLLGGNKLKVFNEQFKIVSEKLDVSNIETICIDHMIAFEEVLLSDLIYKENLSVVAINKNLDYKCEYYIHFQGDKKFKRSKYRNFNKNELFNKKIVQDRNGVINIIN
jgi:hypothetical protein